jgi:hypothetical protein
MTNHEWPELLTLRDTKIYADEGQRIYTTATGYGYEKMQYVRVDIFEAISKSNKALSDELDISEEEGCSVDDQIMRMQKRIDELETERLALFGHDLKWVTEQTPRGKITGKFLMMGGIELVCLRPAKKWWQIIHWLPHLHPARSYGPLEEQQAAAERDVRAWFRNGEKK